MCLAPLMSDIQIKHIQRDTHVLFLTGCGHLENTIELEERRDQECRSCLGS